MVLKEKWKRCLVVLSLALLLAAAAVPASGTAAGRYPDLRTIPPYEVHLGSTLVGGEHHYVVRFSNLVWNAGEGPLELHGTPHFPLDGQFDASQWIYGDPAGLEIQPVGSFAYHPNHSHFHFDGFARYELWRQRDYTRAAANGFATGSPLYTSPKVTFCIMDIQHTDRSTGPARPVYRTCTPTLEGLSQGWGDIYDYNLPDQWVDVGQTPLPDGEYVIRSIADPGNVIFESANKADSARESALANSAATPIRITNGRLATG